MGVSAELLREVGEEYANLFRDLNPGDVGYGLTLQCDKRVTDLGGEQWQAGTTNVCVGLQGWPQVPYPVPAGATHFKILRSYVSVFPVDGYVYQEWVWPGAGVAPGFTPGLFPYVAPMLAPLPRFQTWEWPSVAGYAAPGLAVVPRAEPKREDNKQDRQKKVRALGMGAQGVAAIVQRAGHMAGEGLDVLDAVWKALPKNKRTSPKCGNPGTAKSWDGISEGRNPGSGGCYVTPQQKARDLYNNWDSLDAARAIANLAINELGDRVVGAAYGKASTQANKMGVVMGFLF